MMLRFHTQTAGSSLTAQQPDVNVVRVAYQALSAVLGGTQSLHTNSRDEALALPSEQSALLALRTQQVVGHEIGVTDTVDPLAGSYYIESLTDHLEEEVLGYIAHIDQVGGAVEAIENGFIQLSRDQGQVASALQDLRKAAQSDDNLMPYILTAVKAYATLGEICGALKDVFGEYQQQITI